MVEPFVLDNYATAILHLDGTETNIVGFVEPGPKDQFERQLIDLVPAIPKRRQVKLMRKNLYPLFVICDVFTRCLPKSLELQDQIKAQKAAQADLGVADDASVSDVVGALKRKRAADAQAKTDAPSIGDINGVRHMLWLLREKGDDVTLATSGTTLPAMIFINAVLPWKSFKLTAHELQLDHIQVDRFTKTFMRQIDWKDEHTTAVTIVTGDTVPPTRYVFPAATTGQARFRVLKTGANVLLEFEITKGSISQLSRWRDEFRAKQPKGSGNKFAQQAQITLETGNEVWLAFAKSPMERCMLGKLKTAPTVLPQLGSDWLVDTRLFERLIDLAIDYGLEYDTRLLSMGGAPYALECNCELPTGQCTLTLPLSAGLSGGLVEITNTAANPMLLPAPDVSDETPQDTQPIS